MSHFFTIISIFCLLLTGCATTPPKKVESIPPSLEKLRNLSSPKDTKLSVGPIRIQALRDTAMSIGARGALSWRAQEINQVLLVYEPVLNRVFNFNRLLLDDNVLPPVLIEGRNTLNLSGDDVIRVADRTFTILRQARFVTASPTWREYLWMNYQAPEIPDRTLLPHTKAERVVWEKYVKEGWEAGLTQGEMIFQENLSRLKRDLEGMIRYRSLLSQNMVSPPYVATLDMGITQDGNKMAVNDRVLRITAFPSLRADGSDWKTEIRSHE